MHTVESLAHKSKKELCEIKGISDNKVEKLQAIGKKRETKEKGKERKKSSSNRLTTALHCTALILTASFLFDFPRSLLLNSLVYCPHGFHDGYCDSGEPSGEDNDSHRVQGP